jgi:hypothetical protein
VLNNVAYTYSLRIPGIRKVNIISNLLPLDKKQKLATDRIPLNWPADGIYPPLQPRYFVLEAETLCDTV